MITNDQPFVNIPNYPDFDALKAELAKVKNCVESGASAVVTDCPGCTMQIRGVAEACGQSLRVEHMAELLARTLKLH